AVPARVELLPGPRAGCRPDLRRAEAPGGAGAKPASRAERLPAHHRRHARRKPYTAHRHARSAVSRSAEITRNTKETRIRVKLELDGKGAARLATGLPFLEHMLD